MKLIIVIFISLSVAGPILASTQTQPVEPVQEQQRKRLQAVQLLRIQLAMRRLIRQEKAARSIIEKDAMCYDTFQDFTWHDKKQRLEKECVRLKSESVASLIAERKTLYEQFFMQLFDLNEIRIWRVACEAQTKAWLSSLSQTRRKERLLHQSYQHNRKMTKRNKGLIRKYQELARFALSQDDLEDLFHQNPEDL